MENLLIGFDPLVQLQRLESAEFVCQSCFLLYAERLHANPGLLSVTGPVESQNCFALRNRLLGGLHIEENAVVNHVFVNLESVKHKDFDFHLLNSYS